MRKHDCYRGRIDVSELAIAIVVVVVVLCTFVPLAYLIVTAP